MRPVLAECISAAHGAREPHIPGTQRVRRNLAEHFGFGQGAEVLEGSGRVLRERQRGVRRADRPGPGALLVHCGAAADTGPSLEEGGRDAAPPGATSSPGARGPAPSVRPAVAPPPPEGKFIEADGPCQPLQRAAGMVLEPPTWLLPGEPSERHSVDRTESDSMHMPAKSGERWADCASEHSQYDLGGRSLLAASAGERESGGSIPSGSATSVGHDGDGLHSEMPEHVEHLGAEPSSDNLVAVRELVLTSLRDSRFSFKSVSLHINQDRELEICVYAARKVHGPLFRWYKGSDLELQLVELFGHVGFDSTAFFRIVG